MDQERLNPNQLLEQNSNDGTQQAELVARCLQGNEQAFALLVEQYGNLLLRTAYLLVQDEESAKDVVQDALLLAWKNMHQLREPTFLRAWLIRIVVNQATTLKRQWARKSTGLRQQFLQHQIEQTIQIADVERGQQESALDTWQAIEQLPLNQRVVLVLFYYHRFTMPEIATMLHVSENTLRKRLQIALEKVRKTLNIDLAKTKGKGTMLDNLSTRVGFSGGQRDE
ncbi:MAG: RNA polymerase sigma factor [Ktedonobacteraceae bacterium]|nr:RNA polymerase sigma factor [Ktedonobacteraceae bacterium]